MFSKWSATGPENQGLTSGLSVTFLTIKTILHFFGILSPRLLTFGLLEKLSYQKTPVSQQF
jgi:hypothetical protein